MVAPITVKLNGDVKGLEGALVEGSKHIKVFGQDVGVRLPPKLNLAVQATKGLAKVTKEVASSAKDAAAEEKIFNDAMTAATGKTGDYNAALDDVINQSMKLAFTDTETRKALASLTTATGDAAVSAELLAASQDIARVAGVDLEAASDAVAKAYAGQDTALVRMLPGLEQGADAMGTIENATKLAAGASDTYAKSSQATGEKVKIAFGEIAETVGAALGPSLRQLGAALKPLLIAFGELASVILPPLLKLLDRLINVATLAATAITKIVTAVTKLISKIKELLKPLTDAVNKLHQLDFNPFTASGTATTSAARSVNATAAGIPQTGAVTINIYGDPAVIEARVIRALRGYQARNGVGAVLTPGRM